MSLLLDTNAVIWWIGASQELTQEARRAIGDEDTRVFVSIANAWEIAIKRSIGKLDTPDDLRNQLDRHGFELLPIRLAHTSQVASLPLHHRDPFDRMLVAQAMTEGLTIVTRDRRIEAYDVPTLRA